MTGDGRSAAIPVLVFHSVTDCADSSIWTLPRRTFRRHIEAIAASGRTSLSFGDLVDGLAGLTSLPDRPVVVTFDDGYADNLEAAAVCHQHGLRASVFVTTGYIGDPGMVTPAQARELVAMPDVEVGSHTVRHARLDELSRGDIARELGDSRSHLEQLLSAPVDTLAYPHGNYDDRVKQIAASTGYRGAAAVRMALSHSGDDPFAVARYIVSTRTRDADLEALLDGHGPLASRRERMVTRGYRWARRGRAITLRVTAGPRGR